MNIFTNISDYVLSILASQTFWTALGSIGAIVTLYFIYKQLAASRNVAAYEFLRREDDRFRSKELRHDRSKLAMTLLLKPTNFEEIDIYADCILDYFEDLGLMLRKGLAPQYFVWTMNCYYVLNYWTVLTEYIAWVRKDRDDQTYYSDFEYLYNKMFKLEKKLTKKKTIELSHDERREFLEEELHIHLRPFLLSDLDRIMEIEELSFTKAEAYSKSQFEDLYKEHPEGFFLAEILGEVVGYVIGYISDGVGEFDSLAVDPYFRHLGIAKRLVEHMLKSFKNKGIATCSLEVRTTNAAAISFYKKMGFEIKQTLEKYYEDGSDACLMKMTL